MIRLRIQCSPDASALCRVLNFLAQRGLSPDAVSVKLADGRYSATLCVPGLEAESASVLAEKLRSVVIVHDVHWSRASARS